MMNNRDLRFVLMATVLTVAVLAQVPLAKKTMLPPLNLGKEKVTQMHFYFHDTDAVGKNQSAVVVAQAAVTNQSSTKFGLLGILDNPLTKGPELTSKLIGRAQGIWGVAGQTEFAIVEALTFVFIEGKFNGSSLSVLDRNQFFDPVREFPIVGGTGCFRFARGFMMVKTYWYNDITGDSIAELNVTILHY